MAVELSWTIRGAGIYVKCVVVYKDGANPMFTPSQTVNTIERSKHHHENCLKHRTRRRYIYLFNPVDFCKFMFCGDEYQVD